MTARGLQALVAERLEVGDHDVAHILIVVNDENPRPPRQAGGPGRIARFRRSLRFGKAAR